MKIELDITACTVIQKTTDIILLKLALPDPCWPYTSNNTVCTIHAASGTGAQWVTEHLGLEPEVVQAG